MCGYRIVRSPVGFQTATSPACPARQRKKRPQHRFRERGDTNTKSATNPYNPTSARFVPENVDTCRTSPARQRPRPAQRWSAVARSPELPGTTKRRPVPVRGENSPTSSDGHGRWIHRMRGSTGEVGECGSVDTTHRGGMRVQRQSPSLGTGRRRPVRAPSCAPGGHSFPEQLITQTRELGQ
jgi:hypothetical protein